MSEDAILHELPDALTARIAAHGGLDQLLLLLDDRPALLRRLQRTMGVERLAERQAVANALGRAHKAGHIKSTAASPPAVAAIFSTAAAALARLSARARATAEDGCRLLSSLGVECEDEARLLLETSPAPAHDDDVADGVGCGSDGDLVSRLRPATVCRVLEALDAMPPTHCRLLTEALQLGWGLRVGFYTSQLSERGTEVALFDYAHFAEAVLGVQAYVLYQISDANVPAVERRFAERFGSRLIGLDYRLELDQYLDGGGLLRREGISHVYMLALGTRSRGPAIGRLDGRVTTCVHAVFDGREPFGDRYARISPCVPGSCPVVAHIVRPREAEGCHMREELGIPADATVFGRHGGLHTFDIAFAHEAVAEVARSRPGSTFFVFLNTAPLDGCEGLSNVIHLERTVDDEGKSRFIRTCDAMLHARSRGETFGLAVGEFAISGRPVLTSRVHHDGGLARFHLDVLGERAHHYHDRPSLVALLLGFDRGAAARDREYYAAPYRPFEPYRVMAAFRKTFLSAASSTPHTAPAGSTPTSSPTPSPTPSCMQCAGAAACPESASTAAGSATATAPASSAMAACTRESIAAAACSALNI